MREKTLSGEECRALVNLLSAAAGRPISLGATPWDKRLFAVFHAALEEYAGPYADFPLYSGGTPHNLTLRDLGYTLGSRNSSVPQQHPTTLYAQYPRALLMGAILLNSDVAGGEWWFPGITSVSPACGTLLMFPNLFTHPWGVREVRLGTLYYISTLFSLL